jgi:hypothetical protein
VWTVCDKPEWARVRARESTQADRARRSRTAKTRYPPDRDRARIAHGAIADPVEHHAAPPHRMGPDQHFCPQRFWSGRRDLNPRPQRPEDMKHGFEAIRDGPLRTVLAGQAMSPWCSRSCLDAPALRRTRHGRGTIRSFGLELDTREVVKGRP